MFVAVASIVPTALLGDDFFRTLWRSPKSVTPHYPDPVRIRGGDSCLRITRRDREVVRVGSLPALHLAGRAAAIADQQGWVQTSLSLSHAECHAMAVVMALCSR